MEPGDVIQDRYRLEEPLGQGGMAAVWRAHDKRLERSVAIKILSPRLTDDPAFLVRFFAEAQSVARISHPNVVPVLDFGEFDGASFLVMEFEPGGSVAELVGEPMPPEKALRVVRDAALGVGAAHELDLVHRDIKPGNILLTEDGTAKIADFGIARSAVSEKLTATGQVIGSPHYISPEQASGKGAGPASDVYALGCVLYELLTGAPPFEANNVTAVAVAHVDQEPQPPSTKTEGISAQLDALVLRALAKDPAARWPNGTGLAAAIEGLDTTLARAVVGAGVEPVATTRVERPITDEQEVGAVDEGADRRRLLAVAAVGLVLAALAWAGIAAALNEDEGGSRESVAGAAVAKGQPRKSPSEDATLGGVAAPTPTPTSSPSDEPIEGTGSGAVGRGSGGSGGSGSGGSGSDGSGGGASPTPAQSPTPEPTTTPEPTPSANP